MAATLVQAAKWSYCWQHLDSHLAGAGGLGDGVEGKAWHDGLATGCGTASEELPVALVDFAGPPLHEATVG